MDGSEQSPDGVRLIVEQGQAGTLAVFYWDPVAKVEAVLLYILHMSASPLEQRLWQSQLPMNRQQRYEVLDSFNAWPDKTGLTDESRRSVPWGVLQGAVRGYAGGANLDSIEAFRPPSTATVDFLKSRSVMPARFRNSRDMAASAAGLRVSKAYLLAVYREESPFPAVWAAQTEDITVGRARNLIERARHHGYLTRVEGGLGGALTAKAFDLADEFDALETKTMMGENLERQ
jgi:hypothetical protein